MIPAARNRVAWAAGQMTAQVIVYANNIVAGKTNGLATQSMFTTNTTSSVVRNPSLFVDMDLTWIQLQNGGGAMITPQDGVCAQHLPFASGSTMYFADNANNLITGTVAANANIFGDINLFHLEAPLPSSITPAKLLGSNWRTHWPAIIYKTLVFGTNQFRTITITETIEYDGQNAGLGEASSIDISPNFGVFLPWMSENYIDGVPSDAPVQSGDSGCPCWCYDETNVILLGCWWETEVFTMLADYIPQINAQLAVFGSPYKVVTVF